MQSISTFQVYNASAGSGKTYTLVKEYLKVLLRNEDLYTFQSVLAITFTNKAAGEMKERVLRNLKEFSEGVSSDLFQSISEELSIDNSVLKDRCAKILQAILNNYSAFNITTIDSFTHKIIKSFAYDLGLPLTFEVEMDADELLNQSVDVLISKVGSDKDITKTLVSYTLDKLDDNKSWDISYDIKEFAKLLLNEDDAAHFKTLSDKTLDDFAALQKKLKVTMSDIENQFLEIGEQALNLIDQRAIEFSSFSYSGECPNHFKKLTEYRFFDYGKINFEGRVFKAFNADKPVYAAKTDAHTKSQIDEIYGDLKELFFASKNFQEQVGNQYYLCKLVLRNLIPLAVLTNVNQELQTIKEDNNLQLNADFNRLISENIQDQPAPFIYERIGQRFKYFFIDEMQDTSVLQWKNLIPLIGNSLAQENASLLLVGDGKQAIYRWRGGKAEQFIDLGDEEAGYNPFFIDKKLESLKTNYRSYSEVINFNNNFFQHISQFLQSASYKDLYENKSRQETNSKQGGFVSLDFLEIEEDKEENQQKYARKTLEIIQNLDQGFSKSDVCVIVRTKKDGVQIADYLTQNGVQIVSSETLLLKNSTKLCFIVDFLKLLDNPLDELTQFSIVSFLYEHLDVQQSKDAFYKSAVKKSLEEFIQLLEDFSIQIDLNLLIQQPLYEKVETLVRTFGLIATSDAFVQFFLDEVLNQQKKEVSLTEFLEFWEQKKDRLSIAASENKEAVQIMTIHKSKGLEFPVVIFPCELDIYKEIKPKIWLDELPEAYQPFSSFLIPFNNSLEKLEGRSKELFVIRKRELELDGFNLLYVALTRAAEQLYVITEKKLSKSGENLNCYSGFFINYLKGIGEWEDVVNHYSWGDKNRLSNKEKEEESFDVLTEYISTPWQELDLKLLSSASKLWDSTQEKAIDYGNLIHEILSKIYTITDIEKVLGQYVLQGLLPDSESKTIAEKINKVVQHSVLKEFYSDSVKIFNERELLDVDGQIVIPDRLVFLNEKDVVILDYKTGEQSKKYHQQLLRYQRVLENMNFNVQKKILIYLHEPLLVEEI